MSIGLDAQQGPEELGLHTVSVMIPNPDIWWASNN